MVDTSTYWQPCVASLSERNDHLFHTGIWSDCSFQLESSAGHTETVAAHKLILASSSPVFSAMLFGDMAGTGDTVIINDMEMEAFKILLRFVYTDVVCLDSIELASQVYYGAEKYILPRLKRECLRYIKDVLAPGNVCFVLEFARLYDDKNLMMECNQIIVEQTEKVLSHDSFCEADISTVVHIFSLPHLNIHSEIALLRAAEKYHQKQIEDQTALDASEDPVKNSFISIHTAIQKIRFLTLTFREFYTDVFKSNLLSTIDLQDILSNILTPQYEILMPEGFSDSKVHRRRPSVIPCKGKHCYFIVDKQTRKTYVAQFYFYHKMQSIQDSHSVIFCNKLDRIYSVREKIQRTGGKVYCIHEHMNQMEMDEVMQKFYSDVCSFLIAPESFARNIDMKTIKYVFNFDVPKTEMYLYRSARDFEAETINMVFFEEFHKVKEIEDYYSLRMSERYLSSRNSIDNTHRRFVWSSR